MSEPVNPDTVPMDVLVSEAASHRPVARSTEIVIITGASGAGRTRAAGVLEDQQWFVVDNLPPDLLGPLIDLVTRTGSAVDRLAVVLDARGGQFFAGLLDAVEELRHRDLSVRMIFLDASSDALVRRFEQVRRPHPLAPTGRILDGISAERELLAPVRQRADAVIDTSDLSVNELAREVRAAVSDGAPQALRISIVSFGFKYGLPRDADNVIDVRFLANPYWVSELRHLTGHDAPVRDYVLEQPGAVEFIDRYAAALEPVLAGYEREEKRHMTIAVGCTGGQHRSVAMSEALATRLRRDDLAVEITARDLGRE